MNAGHGLLVERRINRFGILYYLDGHTENMLFAGSPTPEEQEIIAALRLGGGARRKAEERLFGRYAYFIQEGMRKYRLPEDEAFDAYADTILAGIDDIANRAFKGSSSVKTYLFKIFRNKCVDLLRKKTTVKNSMNRSFSLSDLPFQLPDNARSALQKLIDQADLNLLKQKLSELGETCRELLQFSAGGRSDREIAELMEFKTADVVKTTRLRCIGKLRNLYQISK